MQKPPCASASRRFPVVILLSARPAFPVPGRATTHAAAVSRSGVR
jgi:hypothetical protein